MDQFKFPHPDTPVDVTITRGGIIVPLSSMIQPGDEVYRVQVPTFCGGNVGTVDIGCTKPMSAKEFARRVRIVATIQHWRQNDCKLCGDLLRTATTPFEKDWINCSDPTLGPVLGFGIDGGSVNSKGVVG